MKEVLNRIKRGELQLYITILDKYLGVVYNSALMDFDEEESIEITKDVFLKLYSKITNYVSFFDANTYLLKNIKRIAKKKGISLNEKYIESNEVPQQLLRGILIKVSQVNRKNRRKSFMLLVPLTVIVVAISITFVSRVSSSNNTHPKGTIIGINDNVNLIYEEKFDTTEYSLSSIDVIGNNHVLLRFLSGDGSSKNEVYAGSEVVSSFNLVEDQKFLYGNSNNELIFYKQGSLKKYSYSGEILEREDIAASFKQTTDNKAYGIIKSEVNYSLFCLEDFLIVNSYDEPVFDVSNDETTILESHLNSHNYLNIINNRDDIMDYIVDGDNLLIINDMGYYEKYESGELVVERKLQHYNNLDQNFENEYYDGMTVRLLETDEYFIVSIQSEVASTFYATNVSSNFEMIEKDNTTSKIDLLDSIRQGKHEPAPILSEDSNALVIATQFKTARNVSRFNAVYNISVFPIQEYHLIGTGHLVLMEIAGNNGDYLVYTYDDTNNFRIYQVKFISTE